MQVKTQHRQNDSGTLIYRLTEVDMRAQAPLCDSDNYKEAVWTCKHKFQDLITSLLCEEKKNHFLSLATSRLKTSASK